MTDPADNKSVVIERTLDAPIATIWSMWTDADHFTVWYGPMGASVTMHQMEVSVGGTRHLMMEMETPNGPMQMWFVGQFREIDEPNRLVYTESMSDPEGNIAPESPNTQVIVELTSAADNTTHMRMTHEGVPADSPGAQGWTMAIDKLADYARSQT